jgi:4-hydroxythreonine-4-phosphate dehydrogenase
MNTLPRIGFMLGDVTGIGPEIAAKLLATGKPAACAQTIIIGDRRVLELGMRNANVKFAYSVCNNIDEIQWPRKDYPLIDLGDTDPAKYPQGVSSDEAGKLAGDALKFMIDLAISGKLDGISFAPLNKGAMNRGGWKFNDEHQMFASLLKHSGFFGEMNVIDQFSTFRVTSHVALRDAVNMITPERITAAVNLANDTLRAAGKANPRIGVAALNPHNGENGLFGDEEIRIIRPTIDKLKSGGIDCQGPISSDAIFLQALKGKFDGVVMMYHDQGQIATKLLGFNKGVTVTAGLPSVFTTPAHGTAYDIVGKGVADVGAIEHAFTLAARMAAGRKAAAKAA